MNLEQHAMQVQYLVVSRQTITETHYSTVEMIKAVRVKMVQAQDI